MAALAISQVIVTGCVAQVGVRYRLYDPYYRDYHEFDGREQGFYGRWTVETHREPRRDFRRLKKEEQQEYWNWRHAHPE